MWLVVLIALVLVAIWQYLRARNDIFKRIDVKGPKPTLLVGNLFDNKGFIFNFPLVNAKGEILQKWTKQFGKVYGYYEGGTPVMVISDPGILTEIFIKQFTNFHARKVFPGQKNPDTTTEVNMFSASGTRWKRLRNISNPTFSSLKMKQMFPMISSCVDELIGVLDEKSQKREAFNIHLVFQGLTMDVIARTAFGYQTSVQSNPNDKLMGACRQLLSSKKSLFTKFIVFILAVLPEVKDPIISMLFAMLRFAKHPKHYINDHLKKVIEERKKQKSTNEGMKDFIQLMLEAESVEQNELPSTKPEDMANMRIEKRLNADEIIEQSFIFLLAGYETTSTTLALVSYILALHPNIQEKVNEEIEKAVSEVGDVSYDTVQKLLYMDRVIQETLRMYPIARSTINRQCRKSTTINGVYIPEGMNIAVDTMSLHYNEKYWGSDAKEFNPDRFLPENSKNRPQIVYMPFGAGPRICIGMRFALLEAKLALCKVLQKYKIKKCQLTEIPIKIQEASIVTSPENGVFIMLEERKM